MSKGAIALSSVAEALEQCLSAVGDVLSKFRQGTLSTVKCVGTLADGCPGAVRIAASSAAGGLRLTFNVDGVGERTAFAVGLLVGGTRDNGAVATGIRIPPRNRRSRLAALQGIHLRCIGSLLVFVISCRAN